MEDIVKLPLHILLIVLAVVKVFMIFIFRRKISKFFKRLFIRKKKSNDPPVPTLGTKAGFDQGVIS